MAITVIKTEAQRRQHRIYNTLLNANLLPKVEVTKEVINDDILVIWIKHPQEYVPNFKLVWSASKKYYRVYIHIATTENVKANAGYCICTISNGYVAAELLMLYGFLHKHRANNKSEAN